MFSLLLASAFLLLANADLTCKSYTIGTYAVPIDFCYNYAAAGIDYSYKYTCSGSTATLKYYSKASCSGSSTDISSSSSGVVCSGDACTVARVRSYTTTTCATSDSYSESLYVTDQCIASTASSYQYTCSGGNLTLWAFSATDCTGTNVSTLVYADGCVDDDYNTVTCDASSSGSGANQIFNLSVFAIVAAVLSFFF